MIAIIPARGGSKGLPGKNIKPLAGIPLICHTIKQAMKSTVIDKVFVSTDDENIAKIAIEAGADCPFLRPQHLSTDKSLVNDTYIYLLEQLSQFYDKEILDFAVLQPTSPLRMVDDIDNAINLFLNKNADSVVSYTEEHHPIRWHKYIDQDFQFEDIFEQTMANRQEYRISYYPNGAIYVFKSKLIKQGKWYSKKSFAYLMPRSRSVDIDTYDDFMLAECLINIQNK
ncbi:hypothetical protein LCGC14_1930300 [marine sediment metagenome]|uniref:N-acylneuraminate cytidylyltransferase n=1 Tax=marine sediment metagenome TaxID=412755 RepID=A0A0F9FN85_9ZZZZ